MLHVCVFHEGKFMQVKTMMARIALFKGLFGNSGTFFYKNYFEILL